MADSLFDPRKGRGGGRASRIENFLVGEHAWGGEGRGGEGRGGEGE